VIENVDNFRYLIITVDSPHNVEAHHESLRRRLLYIHEEMKIYCDRSIVTSDTSIEKLKELHIKTFKNSVGLGERTVKV